MLNIERFTGANPCFVPYQFLYTSEVDIKAHGEKCDVFVADEIEWRIDEDFEPSSKQLPGVIADGKLNQADARQTEARLLAEVPRFGT